MQKIRDTARKSDKASNSINLHRILSYSSYAVKLLLPQRSTFPPSQKTSASHHAFTRERNYGKQRTKLDRNVGHGTGSFSGEEDGNMLVTKKATSSSSGKKVADVKTAASARFDKAKAAAAVGAQKVKFGTSVGIKWVKKQYQKYSS